MSVPRRYADGMERRAELEQHIAVFGGSGSGKTVLVSSFYGAMQEPEFLRSSMFDVTSDDPGQGHKLFANYLGMRDSARTPPATKFSSTPYSFSLKVRQQVPKDDRHRSFDVLRLVWHDYPGEWFEEDVSGPEEAKRRVDTFRALLGSDVAILLVDGQRLLDHAGEEERYLKSLFGSFRSGLLRLRDPILTDGKPLTRFPRIWIVALSKADLLPDMDVFQFRDLVIGKASDDLDEVRRVIEMFIDSPDALSVGEDFLRLSSAKFEPNRIETVERIGLDLILPVAAILPLQRKMRWLEMTTRGARIAGGLLEGATVLALTLVGPTKVARFARLDKVKGMKTVIRLLGQQRSAAAIAEGLQLGVDQLKRINTDALAKHDYMRAVLTQFGLDLAAGEDAAVLLTSRR